MNTLISWQWWLSAVGVWLLMSGEKVVGWPVITVVVVANWLRQLRGASWWVVWIGVGLALSVSFVWPLWWGLGLLAIAEGCLQWESLPTSQTLRIGLVVALTGASSWFWAGRPLAWQVGLQFGLATVLAIGGFWLLRGWRQRRQRYRKFFWQEQRT